MSHSLDTVLITTSLRPEGREVTRRGGALARAAGTRVVPVHGMAIPVWFGEAPLDALGEPGQHSEESTTALGQQIAAEAEQQARRSADGSYVAESPQRDREEIRATTETAS